MISTKALGKQNPNTTTANTSMMVAEPANTHFPAREDRGPIVGAGFSKYISNLKPSTSESALTNEV